jgi:hypothetical protein
MRNRFIALLLALCAPLSQAAVEVISAEAWDLYRGNSIVQPRVSYPSKAACQAAAPLDVQHRCVGRETFVRRPDAPPPPPTCTTPRPAQETRTQACPTGTTGSWSQSRSYDAAAYPTCWVAGAWTPAEAPAGSCVPVVEPPPPPPPVGGVATTFDALYAPGFTLKALDNAAIVQQPRPAKSTGVTAPSYTDPAYGTKVFKITDTATDGNVANVAHIRHDYSRRQAFNADSTRYLAQDANGFWALFDGNTFKRIPGKRSNGMLAGLAGDAEPIWHPTDPKLLWYTAMNGGMVWYEKNVETDTDTVLVNFAGRLPWSNVARMWTKSEGTTSADGRYFALMAETEGFSTLGLVCWDRVTDTITTLPASAFGGARPDHISMSPSGKYVVPSWAFNKTLGTRAYTREFSSYRILHVQSEHSDLAFGPAGEDMYVVTDYDSGQIRAVDMDTGASINLLPMYPASGASYAAHISGKAYKRPGWVVISTYADFSNYTTSPASPQQGMYRKVMAVELKAGGRVLNIAHTQSGRDYGGYFGEHQATVNLDFSRVVWAVNFGSGTRIESVMVGLPSGAIPK